MVKGYMKYDVLRGAEKYTKVHKRKRLRHRVVTVLAGVVVFCTTYALILPAITLEKQCDIPEHTHTDACYAQVTSVEKRVPVCSVRSGSLLGLSAFMIFSPKKPERSHLWYSCGS